MEKTNFGYKLTTILVCVQCLFTSSAIAQTTTAPSAVTTRPLDLDDDETSGEEDVTTAAVTTAPLSDIDDDETTISELSTTTETTTSSTTSTTTTTSTTISTAASTTSTTSSSLQPSSGFAMRGCEKDRDCISNEHCVARNSTAECSCKPGYSLSSTGLCIEKVKHFGERIVFQVDPNITPQRYEDVAETLVNNAFSSQPWFRGVSVLNFAVNSGEVSYELITDDEPNVNAALIQSIFETFLETEPLFDDPCRCEDSQCSVANLLLLASASCSDTGQIDPVLCEDSIEISQYCDSTSTVCTASTDGRISCPCKDGYVFNTDNSCTRSICANDIDCNYGTCDDSTPGGMCLCQWGFDGTNCDNPWLLVTTILLSFAVLLLLAGATYLAFRGKIKKRKLKIADMQEELSKEPKYGYRKNNPHYNISPWEEGPVIPTSYSNVGRATALSAPIAAGVSLSSAQSTSVISGSPPVIRLASNNSLRSQMEHNVPDNHEPPEPVPAVAEINHIRNIARRRLSSRREAAIRDSMDFVLPNQALE